FATGAQREFADVVVKSFSSDGAGAVKHAGQTDGGDTTDNGHDGENLRGQRRQSNFPAVRAAHPAKLTTVMRIHSEVVAFESLHIRRADVSANGTGFPTGPLVAGMEHSQYSGIQVQV